MVWSGTHVMLNLMIRTVAVQGYRSLRDLLLPLGQLSVITGANGSGKSSVYRSLRLLADAALNSVVRFPRPRRRLAVDLLGGSRNYRAQCSPGNLRGGAPRETEGCEPQARLWRRYLRLQHRFGLPSPPSASHHVWP